jgi:hypothetical protein
VRTTAIISPPQSIAKCIGKLSAQNADLPRDVRAPPPTFLMGESEEILSKSARIHESGFSMPTSANGVNFHCAHYVSPVRLSIASPQVVVRISTRTVQRSGALSLLLEYFDEVVPFSVASGGETQALIGGDDFCALGSFAREMG